MSDRHFCLSFRKFKSNLPNTWNTVDCQPNVSTDKSYPKEIKNRELYKKYYDSCSVMFGRYSWISYDIDFSAGSELKTRYQSELSIHSLYW